jgi:putative chitinase
VHRELVGRGGASKAPDVKTVQILLNFNDAAPPVAVDGATGYNTIRAIEAFERQTMGMADPSGRIDPATATLAAACPPGSPPRRSTGS